MSSVPPPPSPSQPPPLYPELPDGVERTPDPEPAPGDDRAVIASVPVWGPFMAAFCALAAALVGSALVAAVVASTGAEVDEDTQSVLIGGTLIQFAALIAFTWFFADKLSRGRVRPSTLGFRLPPIGPAIGWTALAYVAFITFAIIYAAALGDVPEQQLVEDLREEDSVAVIVSFAVMVALVAPIAEELFFRGFLFGVLREKMGVAAAAVVAGSIFGVAHVAGTPLRTLAPLVILGVVLCLLYWKTSSLLPCIAVHSLNNSVSFVFTRELPAGAGVAVILGSVAIVLLIAGAVAWRGRRAAPA